MIFTCTDWVLISAHNRQCPPYHLLTSDSEGGVRSEAAYWSASGGGCTVMQIPFKGTVNSGPGQGPPATPLRGVEFGTGGEAEPLASACGSPRFVPVLAPAAAAVGRHDHAVDRILPLCTEMTGDAKTSPQRCDLSDVDI
jgi:hypothetical protein